MDIFKTMNGHFRTAICSENYLKTEMWVFYMTVD